MLKNLKDELNQIQQGVEQKQRELQQKINMPLPAQLREECAKSIVAAAINSLKDKIKSNGYIDYKKLLFKHYYYCGDCRVAIYVTADARQYKDFCYDNSVKYSTPPFYENSHGAECVPFIIPKNDFLQIRDSDSIGTYIQCRKKEDVFSIFERAKEIAKAEGFKAPRIKKRLILLNLRYTHAVTKMDDFYNLQNNRWPWFICIILGVLFDMAKEAVTNSVPIGVIVAILGSVVCFLVIRFLENMLGKGIDKATDAVANQFAKRSQKNEPASGNLADRFQTSAPSQPTATQTGVFCTKCGARLKNNPVGYIKSHK